MKRQKKNSPARDTHQTRREGKRLNSLELLEPRLLLSGISRYTFVYNGDAGKTVVKLDGQGNCLRASGPERADHQDCMLGGGESELTSLAITFENTVLEDSIQASDFKFSQSGAVADPLRVSRASIRGNEPNGRVVWTRLRGDLSEVPGSDLILRTTGINRAVRRGGEIVAGDRLRAQRVVAQITQDAPPSVSPGDITAPHIAAVTPSDDQVVRGSQNIITVNFSEPIDSNSLSTSTVSVTAAGGDELFGNSNDQQLGISHLSYDASQQMATIGLQGLLTDDGYRIKIDGVKDLNGNLLDGDRDGAEGGAFTSDYRIDNISPAFNLDLSPASDTGFVHDQTTNIQSDVGIIGVVDDGDVSQKAGYTVELDADGDAQFDDGTTVTDINGRFTVASTLDFNHGANNVRVRVTDLAGNSRIAGMQLTVDSSGPLVVNTTGARIYDQSPTEVLFKANEPLQEITVLDLSNYMLRKANSNQLFFGLGSQDLSSLITEAEFVSPGNELRLQISPNLPDGYYRLIVRNDGTLVDISGNQLHRQAEMEFVVGDGGIQRLPVVGNGITPLPNLNLNQRPMTTVQVFEGRHSSGLDYEQTVGSTTTSLVTGLITVPEAEAPLGPDSNNPQFGGVPQDISDNGINLGVDPNEDPDVLIVGTDFGIADVDFYQFTARAGEIVRFDIVDLFGFSIPFAQLSIIDLGTDDQIGGTGPAADRPIVRNADFFFGNAGFFNPVNVDFMITGITGEALDDPQNDTLNPVGSEDRLPEDRTYILAVDASVFIQDYVIFGSMTESFTRLNDTQQIVYLNFDGADDVPFPDFATGGTQFVDIPRFNVSEFGFDPIFQEQFVDSVIDSVRKDYEQVRALDINPAYSLVILDSLHYPDPGNGANVTKVHIGGRDTQINLPVFGIADSVDTGNQVGDNHVFVFTQTIAEALLQDQFPITFGDGDIDPIAEELALIASHELGHVIGLWHTALEPTIDAGGNFTQVRDNIIDSGGDGLVLGRDIRHRFDNYTCFRLEDFDLDGVLDPGEDLNGNGILDCFGTEFYEGVADSVGVTAWGNEGRDLTAPRIIDVSITPGEIEISFSEGVDVTTLRSATSAGLAPTIVLERSGLDQEYSLTTFTIDLLPIVTSGLNGSLYDADQAKLTLRVADPSQLVENDFYRLTLRGSSANAIQDSAGNPIDGEFDLPLNQRISPEGNKFPTGNGVIGGNFVLDFIVSNDILVDGDFVGAATGFQGTPFRTLQSALDAAQFAALIASPVEVNVAPSSAPYVSVTSLLDPSPGDTSDQGNLIIPDLVHLVLDSNLSDPNLVFTDVMFVAVPTDGADGGAILKIDVNDTDPDSDGIITALASLPTVLPLGPNDNVGLAHDGTNLFFVKDAPNNDSTIDDIYVLDPDTGSVRNILSPVDVNGLRVPSLSNIDGLAVNDQFLFASNSTTNRIFVMDKATGTVIRDFAVSSGDFDAIGGMEYNAVTDRIVVSGNRTDGNAVMRTFNYRTGAKIGTDVVFPSDAISPTGVGIVNGRLFAVDQQSDELIAFDTSGDVIRRTSLGVDSGSGTVIRRNPLALAGPSNNRIVVQMLGTRIDVLGEDSALIAIGEDQENPVIFTSLFDTSIVGVGVDNSQPGDWMGIAFRPNSNDFASRIENVEIHNGGGAGEIFRGRRTDLSPISLFDARPTVLNSEISNNLQSAIQASPNSFERLLSRSGPDLFWNIEAGTPLVGDWNATRSGDEFGVAQVSASDITVAFDLNDDRKLNPTTEVFRVGSVDALGREVIVGDFNSALPGDEIAVFDRSSGVWSVDIDKDFDIDAFDLTIFFGQHGDIPLVGDWDPLTPGDEIGLYRPVEGEFIVDLNGNRIADSFEIFPYGDPNLVPLAGDFASGTIGAEFGVYNPETGEFQLDRNADRSFNPGEPDTDGNGLPDPGSELGVPNGILDLNDGPFAFGIAGSQPVIGDWAPNMPGDEIGTLDTTGSWVVDRNGNLVEDGDEITVQFGEPGDIPAHGNWAVRARDAGDEFGVFDSFTGLWTIDVNSNEFLDDSEDIDGDRRLDDDEDLNQNGVLDPGEDVDGDTNLDVFEDLNNNNRLNFNDGPYRFTPALRTEISEFVFDNSLNSVWVTPGFQTVSDAHWDDVQLPHVLTGTVNVQALAQIGVVPTLEMEPGLVVKMGVTSLAVGGFGSTLLADSDLDIGEPRIHFTSLLDDDTGPDGRPHDTNNDNGSLGAKPGDWGGLVINPGATSIINGAQIEYAGNLRVPFIDYGLGFFLPLNTELVTLNPITLNGGPIFATITNNVIANTNNLQDSRLEPRLASDVAAIGVIEASALGDGPNSPRIPFNANPFIRGNDVTRNNGLNGLEIRTDLIQEPVTNPGAVINTFIEADARWDDTDITHILLGTLNFDSLGGSLPFSKDIVSGEAIESRTILLPGVNLTLASNPIGAFDIFDETDGGASESLVLKFGGRFSQQHSLANPFQGAVVIRRPGAIVIGAGFNVGLDDGNANTAFTPNFHFDWGGDSSIVIEGVDGNPELGIPRQPVIMTSIRDDVAGPGNLLEDTNNDGDATLPSVGDWEGVHVGAWARNFGAISLLNGESLSPSKITNAEIRYANTAVRAQSQSIEISNSLIRNSAIAIDSGYGPLLPQVLNPLRITRKKPEPHMWNNILAENGIGFRQTGGADSNNFFMEHFPPRAIFINNTLDGNGEGIQLITRSGPLLMNNAITNTTGTGVFVDASSLNVRFEGSIQHLRPQVIRNLFFANGLDGNTGTVPGGLGGLEILNADPQYNSRGNPDYNYRPLPSSPLVDSSLSEYGTSVGDFGTVITPELDQFGVFRLDHFGTPNVGIGSRPFLDLGAVELVDVSSSFPTVINLTPSPDTIFQNGTGPANVIIEMNESVQGITGSTFFVQASGGDGSFLEGNEIRLAGSTVPDPQSDGTRFIFTPANSSRFTNFSNEIFQVVALGTGTRPITSVATGDRLDGEYLGSFPSGDGVEGGDFRATFIIGAVVTGDILYVDDDDPEVLAGIPADGSIFLPYQTIPQALANAASGDTILVKPGLYTDAVEITFPVIIESTDGAFPEKDASGRVIPGTGTIISVLTLPTPSGIPGAPGLDAAITVRGIPSTEEVRIGNTDGGSNHGFVIMTSPVTGPTLGQLPAGIGIDVLGSRTIIEGNVILSNTIGIQANNAGSNALPEILNNLITGNITTGVEITSSSDAVARIVNNTIPFNNAGVTLRDDGTGRQVADVQNNTITSNTQSGLLALVTSDPLVKHNNAWGNSQNVTNFGGTLANLFPSQIVNGNPVPDRVCTLTTDVCGNISVNPFYRVPVDTRSLVDRSDFFRFADFRLQSVSYLIDRGRDDGAVATDFDGINRIVNIVGVGSEVPGPDSPRNVDIGAYEYLPSAVASASGERSMSGGVILSSGGSGGGGSTSFSSATKTTQQTQSTDLVLSQVIVPPDQLSNQEELERWESLVEDLLSEWDGKAF